MARDGGFCTFSAGFPTYEALANRGLITIENTNSLIWWYAGLTDAGWTASGIKREPDCDCGDSGICKLECPRYEQKMRVRNV